LLKANGEVDSAGDFVDIYGRAYSSKIIPTQTKEILSARGASMLIKKKIFWELGGFDKKFFVSFEDVDLGWRTWLLGYKVVIIPDSIVYHYSGKTVEKLKEEIQFHGSKNTFLLRLTNFEWKFRLTSSVVLFFVVFIRKVFRISVISDPEMEHPLPSTKIMLKAVFWIMKNRKHIINKRKKINSTRKISTNDLIKKQLITKI